VSVLQTAYAQLLVRVFCIAVRLLVMSKDSLKCGIWCVTKVSRCNFWITSQFWWRWWNPCRILFQLH